MALPRIKIRYSNVDTTKTINTMRLSPFPKKKKRKRSVKNGR